MTWDSIFVGLLLIGCIGGGMVLGAWIAARGFEKSMTSMLEDPDSPWNKKEALEKDSYSEESSVS